MPSPGPWKVIRYFQITVRTAALSKRRALGEEPRKALREGISKVNLQQGCQLTTTMPHKMAPRTRKRLQERGRDAPTKGLLWYLARAALHGKEAVRCVWVSALASVCRPLGPLGLNFSQHGPTTRPSRRKDCRESMYAFGSRLALQCRGFGFQG